MFEKRSCNMKPLESYIRAFIATLILIYATSESSVFLSIVSIVIYYTAFTKFCFAYNIFNINKKYSLQNYYLSLLPKHRPSPVFIFDINGKVLFKNNTANTQLSHIKSVGDIGLKKFEHLISTDALETVLFEYNNRFHQVELQGVSSEGFILAYLTDVTEVMELNDAIEETQREVIYAMGEIGETRSKETGNHVKRVALYSKELALLYGLSYEIGRAHV